MDDSETELLIPINGIVMNISLARKFGPTEKYCSELELEFLKLWRNKFLHMKRLRNVSKTFWTRFRNV